MQAVDGCAAMAGAELGLALSRAQAAPCFGGALQAQRWSRGVLCGCGFQTFDTPAVEFISTAREVVAYRILGYPRLESWVCCSLGCDPG